ncbi:PTS sugar transporter subunit IIB [Vagococcus coleopterorum]|uniref:PTS sugar transporter subunit IIB n=1 Tax=Vagococcus coleopterorum TaxID=2714946 RepID=A0A6G8APF2_9ENTE|nr:PTS sugar transporter subunit IIB [Vagococcus coleopterorum]QIL46822.1 PTS sugar transporter subunit IIB [Vagococcus coleopterorum]
MRVLVSCANGSGTSLMMKKTVEKALVKMGFNITQIHHCPISEGKSTAASYDVVFTPLNFVEMFKNAEKKGIAILGVKNVLSEKEIIELVENSNLKEKFLK